MTELEESQMQIEERRESLHNLIINEQEEALKREQEVLDEQRRIEEAARIKSNLKETIQYIEERRASGLQLDEVNEIKREARLQFEKIRI